MQSFSSKAKFDYPKAAVDLIVFTIKDEKLQVLLVKMKKKPYQNHWAFPGGLVKIRESLDKASQRELHEKTGLRNVYLEQLYSFGDPRRDPFSRVVSIAYFALINSQGIRLKTTLKYAGINWFPIDNLPRLAYDHREMAKYALKRLRYKLEYTNVVYSLLPKYFALSELQKVYEIILKRRLDKRNFRKKILSLKLLIRTGRFLKEAHRPAELYRFRKRKPMIIEII